jgi:hypothetical protein
VTPLFDQFFVGRDLDGAAVLHRDDAVRSFGRRETVRDRDDRPSRGDSCERALDRGLGRRVARLQHGARDPSWA